MQASATFGGGHHGDRPRRRSPWCPPPNVAVAAGKSAVGRIRAPPATGSLANVSVDPSLVLAPGPWTHRMVAANGGRFHVALSGADDGEAPLVLLLHGFPQFWLAWREQLEPLA